MAVIPYNAINLTIVSEWVGLELLILFFHAVVILGSVGGEVRVVFDGV